MVRLSRFAFDDPRGPDRPDVDTPFAADAYDDLDLDEVISTPPDEDAIEDEPPSADLIDDDCSKRRAA